MGDIKPTQTGTVSHYSHSLETTPFSSVFSIKERLALHNINPRLLFVSNASRGVMAVISRKGERFLSVVVSCFHVPPRSGRVPQTKAEDSSSDVIGLATGVDASGCLVAGWSSRSRAICDWLDLLAKQLHSAAVDSILLQFRQSGGGSDKGFVACYTYKTNNILLSLVTDFMDI